MAKLVQTRSAIRTVTRTRTLEVPTTVYTLRSNVNSVLALTPKNKRTAVVGFQTHEAAFNFGRLVESYKFSQKEWPDFSKPTIDLLDDGRDYLKLIDVMEWDIDTLKHECALRYMNVIIIDKKLTGNSLKGLYITLDMDTPMFINHLNFLWDISL